jgi:sulfopyruvate decarboxylase subunit beta
VTLLEIKSVLFNIVTGARGAFVVSTCGFISRDLQDIRDAASHFYLVGSMGMALPVGLGVAIAHPNDLVIVIDGDGSLLMNIGALAMVGDQRPANLVHFVLDNGVHESTGGQSTIPMGWIVEVARQMGYREAMKLSTPDPSAWINCINQPGPSLFHVPVARRKGAPKPRIVLAPPQLARRFAAALNMTPQNAVPRHEISNTVRCAT